MKQVLHLDGHTATLNELLRSVRTRIHLKKRDRIWVALACRVQGITLATTKRRVSLRIILDPGKRGADSDAWWKSLLDSLVKAGALHNDSPGWCECGPVEYVRGDKDAMEVTLEDL